MPVELWTRLVVDIPLLAVLLLVLWKGGEKVDKLGEKIDKMSTAVRGLSSRVELVGKLTDARLELHEERTTKNGTVVKATVTHIPTNGVSTQHVTQPSWPDTPTDTDE